MKKLGQEPAFPKNSFTNQYQIGMSKRFYAVCAAMQGLCSNPNVIITGDIDLPKFINSAYMIADELLKQEDDE